MSEIIGIRSTCRRFRAISNELAFWYNEDFDLLDLILHREWYDPIEVHEDCQAFLKVLLSDEHLVQCLARRSNWLFRNLIGFQTVMELVPSFSRNTTAVLLESDFTCEEPARLSTPFSDASDANSRDSLSLRGLRFLEELDFRNLPPPPMQTTSPSPIQMVFANLSTCHRLTSLRLSSFRLPLDLGLLARSCPLLTDLRLEEINQYYGTLQPLSYLEDLDVREFPSHVGVAPDYIFPTTSAMSLTRLSIIHQEPFYDNDESTPLWPTSLLNAFVNLTSLCVSPLTDKICDFIVRADVNLTTSELKSLLMLKLLRTRWWICFWLQVSGISSIFGLRLTLLLTGSGVHGIHVSSKPLPQISIHLKRFVSPWH